jgi:hypothetical protein
MGLELFVVNFSLGKLIINFLDVIAALLACLLEFLDFLFGRANLSFKS